MSHTYFDASYKDVKVLSLRPIKLFYYRRDAIKETNGDLPLKFSWLLKRIFHLLQVAVDQASQSGWPNKRHYINDSWLAKREAVQSVTLKRRFSSVCLMLFCAYFRMYTCIR